MEYSILGKTALKISRLGFGGIPIQRIDALGTKKLIDRLIAGGINFIDTARGYTVSEEYLGYALEGRRDKFVLATKSMSRSAEAMSTDIETSLKNLRTDYIDLYQIHNPTLAQLEQVVAEGGALEALLIAQKAGKIGHIGVTAHSVEVFKKALEIETVETIMFPFNIVENQGLELIKECKKRNIGFIDMKPLAGGAIENADLAIRYISQFDAVSVIIPGMATEEEISQNLKAINNSNPLDAAELAEIEEIKATLGTQFCRRCGYCAPCSVGINIPGVFLMEGYLTRYGLGDWARSRYGAMDKKAVDCIGCGECEARCPYELPIRNMLKRAAKNFGE